MFGCFSYMFSNRYRHLLVAFLTVYTYVNTELCGVYEHFKIDIEWEFALLTILLITTLLVESNRIIEQPLRKLINPDAHKIAFPIVFFIAGSIIGGIITIAIVLFVGMILHNYSFSQNIIPLKLNLTYASLVNLLFHLINTVVYYFKEYHTQKDKAEKLKRYHEEAELQILKSQINPHFLFNNLNVLSSLVMQNKTEANDFIEAFSEVYRYILTTHQKEIVPLSEEINFMKPYLFLLNKRFDNGIQIRFELSQKSEETYIIPAALQMLVENAIKHNIASKAKPLIIEIVSDNKNISVTNNLQLKKTKPTSTEIGLSNIIKRYELISDTQVSINQTDNQFKVVLPVIHINKPFINEAYSEILNSKEKMNVVVS